jgi:hypothetical protein
MILTETTTMSLNVINPFTQCVFCEAGVKLIIRPNLMQWQEENIFHCNKHEGEATDSWNATSFSFAGKGTLKLEVAYSS